MLSRGQERSHRDKQRADRARANRRFIGGCCFLVASVCSAAVIGLTVLSTPWKWNRLSGAHHTTGRVVDIHGSRAAATIQRRVRYVVAGKSYEIGGVGITECKLGEAVWVAYARNHPEDGTIDRFTETFFLLISVWGVGGLIFMVAGHVVLRSGGDRGSFDTT